jgi:signal transduction histidine kinase
MNGIAKLGTLFGVLVGIFLVMWFVGTVYPSAVPYEFVVVSCGAGIVITLCLMDRLSIYRQRLRLALRHVLDNNFETGISVDGRDELSQLAGDFNRIIDRLHEYDQLRGKKIFVAGRLIKSLVREISDCVMIFDLEAGRVSLNQATQELFGISQDELSIDSVIRLETNSAFAELYETVISGRANTVSGTIGMYLPILRAMANVTVNLFAIKDPDETLHTVVCLLAKQ